MHSTLLTLATAVSAVAAHQGFNYGSTFTDGRPKQQSDFEASFRTAASLPGTDGGFTSARLYTMVQGGTTNEPISAIPAAISTKTSLLLGLWASGGDASFANEIAALESTIKQYCDKLDGLVAGISVGSEDLYRITPTGVASNAGPGAQPETLVKYIKQVRDTIKGSCMQNAPIIHVDTWTAYVEASNKQVIEALDAVGVDTYPYFELTKPNGIENGKSLYETAINNVKSAAEGKDIWITETGWPTSGKTSGKAEANTENAKTYWDEVGCPSFGKTNIWWYTMEDADPTTPNPSFGLIGSLGAKPYFDLSCKNVPTSTSTSASSSGTSTGSASGASGTLVSAPFPTGNGTSSSPAGPSAPASNGSGSGSGSGSSSASGSGSTPSSVSGSSKLNAMLGVVVGLGLAVFAL